MKKNVAMPGNFLSKEDFETPRVLTIKKVKMEGVRNPSTNKEEDKSVLYLQEEERGIILNSTNWDSIESVTGEDDSDNWSGSKIELYNNPEVVFGSEKTGGIRVREPSVPEAPSQSDDSPPSDPPF